MELRQYWNLFRKWLWLITLTAIIAAASAYLFSIQQTPVYQASTRLRVIQGSSNNATLTYGDLVLSEKISHTYVQLLTARPVLQATIDKLGLVNITPAALAGEINVTPIRDTQLIVLKVKNIVPAVAAQIANTLPQVFVDYNRKQQTARFRSSEQALAKQLSELGQQVQSTEAASKALKGASDTTTLSRQALLENQLAQYRSSYGNVLSQLESIRLAEANAQDTLAVVELAIPPKTPIYPRTRKDTLLAAIVGAMIGLGAAFLIEYLDDTVKTPDDIARLTSLTTLGVIAKHGKEGEGAGIVTLEHPHSPVAEAYRTIRTGIRFASVDKPIRTLLVTSPGPSEGKSTIAANLAIVIAQSGKKVLLIDADLRKPLQHKLWKLANNLGLTAALLSSQETIDTNNLFTATSIDNLHVMTSGQIPPNPSELLGSQKMQRIIEQLLQSFDFLVFDMPPALAVTDAAILGQIVDGIIMVIEAGRTREPALIQTVQQFQKGKARVIGFILNRFQAQRSSGYYYYYYDQYYAKDESGKTAYTGSRRHHSSKGKSWKQRLWRTVRRSS